MDLNGGTSSQNLAGIYPSSKQINLVTPTRSGYTFAGWKVTSGDGIVISNMFPDGSFENNIYSLSLSTSSNLNEGISVTNEIYMYGSYSLMNYHAGQYINYYQEFDAIPNHKYYFSHYFYNKSFGINTSETVWNYSDMSFYYDSQEHWNGSGIGSNSIINEWHKVSIINTSPSVSSIIKTAACETNATNKGQHFYIDGAMLIDLTQTFGVGNEPTKEWMDKNINYFDNYMLYLFDQDTTIEAQWK